MAYNELEQRGTADFPVEFFHIDYAHPRYQMSAHWHREIEIIRVLEGKLHVKLNTNEYIAEKGDVLFVNSETVHQATPEDCVYECLVFHIDFLYTETVTGRFFIESILNRDYVVKEYFSADDVKTRTRANEIFKAMKGSSTGYKFRVIAAFYNFFAEIIDANNYSLAATNVAPCDKNILKLKKILSYIRENYDKQIALTDMAKHAEMSFKYFGTFFKGMTGKTPVDYLNEYRIEKASRKLMNTDMSITEIAYSCGFNDLSYFIKMFKRINKVSPGKYRKDRI